MSWQFSILLFFVFSVMQSLQRHKYSQISKLPSKVVPALAYLTGVLPLGIIVGLGTRNVQVNWSGTTVPVLLIMGLFIGVFNWLAFVASKKLTVATFQTIFQIYAVTAVIGGWLLLDETLDSQQVFGSVLLIIGAVLAAQAYKAKVKSKFIGSAAFIGVIASVSLGLGIIAEKASLGKMTLGAYFIFGYFIQTLSICIIGMVQLKKLDWSSVKKYDWKNIVYLGILDSLVGFFYIYAINTSDNVGLVSVTTTFQMPLTAVAGYFILKEKEVGWKLALGVVIAFIGLVVTAI